MPDGQNADVAYTAVSPRFILHTNWLSREYVILNYTHYTYGSEVQSSQMHSYTFPGTAAEAGGRM